MKYEEEAKTWPEGFCWWLWSLSMLDTEKTIAQKEGWTNSVFEVYSVATWILLTSCKKRHCLMKAVCKGECLRTSALFLKLIYSFSKLYSYLLLLLLLFSFVLWINIGMWAFYNSVWLFLFSSQQISTIRRSLCEFVFT